MSTAFEIRYDICDCCGRYEERHIGNSYRILRAYDDVMGWPAKTWADWREILRRPGVRVFDEYDNEHDIEAIIAAWRPAPDEAAEANEGWHHRFGTSLGDYTDPEGFHMSVRAFS